MPSSFEISVCRLGCSLILFLFFFFLPRVGSKQNFEGSMVFEEIFFFSREFFFPKFFFFLRVINSLNFQL